MSTLLVSRSSVSCRSKMAFSFEKMDKIARGVVGFGIGGMIIYRVSAELFPHLCKRRHGIKDKNGVFIEVPDRCREQFNAVAMKFGLKNADKVNLFVNRGFRALSAGSSLLPGGAVIGLPRWFVFQTEEDVQNSCLKLGETVSWDSEVGIAVTESFLPTDDVIAFTIGHELAHTERQLQFKLFNTFAPPLWLYLIYRVTKSTDRILKHRVVLNGLLDLAIFGLSLYAYKRGYEKMSHLAEFDADKVSAECDPRMAQGGVDLFTTTLKRNLIQRELLGKKGEKFYTEEGNNINQSLISTHPDNTDRIEKLKALSEALPN